MRQESCGARLVGGNLRPCFRWRADPLVDYPPDAVHSPQQHGDTATNPIAPVTALTTWKGRHSVERRRKQPTGKGPAEWFTGDVWIDPITQGQPPSTLNIGAVHFTPGARTAWHSHSRGQTLYVTEGRGMVRTRAGDTVEVAAGDVIYAPDGEEHWHGAAPEHFMTHLSITEGPAHWGDHVTDAEYEAARSR